MPVPLADLMNGNFNWPHLEDLNLLIGTLGNISGIRHELYSMTQLKKLSLHCSDFNKHDRKALLRMPFLSSLTSLELYLPRETSGDYVSNLIRRTKKLEFLSLHGYDLGDDYLGDKEQDTLKHLIIDNIYRVSVAPLLAHVRPNIQSLSISYGFMFNAELEDFITRAKEAFPNLRGLGIGPSPLVGAGEDQDWSCLSRIDLPNLERLFIHTSFKEAVGIAAPTVKLPKLEILGLGLGPLSRASRPSDWEQHAETMFSSPVLQQMVDLSIYTTNFRLGSLTVLCKYASEFKNLEKLHLHVFDMDGVAMILDAGRGGGFPKLKKITMRDMNTALVKDMPSNWILSREWDGLLQQCLSNIWPEIQVGYSSFLREEEAEKYGQPDEFDDDNPEDNQVEAGLEELQINE